MDKKTFFETYAPLAIEQQQKYGIPASVTLAQMALESGWGEGRAIKEGNNAFCVKGSYNSQYVLISDNAKNEKFRKYDTLAQSFDDHSRLLMKDRYRQAPGSDYKVWTAGIQKGGYAYPPDGYAEKLNNLIESNNLQRFDVMDLSSAQRVDRQVMPSWGQEKGRFSFPIEAANGRLEMTSDYGHRNLKGHENHHGIDIGVPVGTKLLATEDNGRVIEAGWDSKGGGNYVKVQYDRPDGSNYQVAFLHMSRIDVRKGDTVNAGQQLGLSGNSGASTGPHLDMRIRVNGEYIDPKQYLAEIAVRGGIDTTLVRKNGNGEDLLASLKANVTVPEGSRSGFVHVDGGDLAKLMNGYIWGSADGQRLEVGSISVYKVSDLMNDLQARAVERGYQWGQLSGEQLDELVRKFPEGQRDAVRQYAQNKLDAYYKDGDNHYVMTAVINGKPDVREISKEMYDKFLAADTDNGQRLHLFDMAYQDIAITTPEQLEMQGMDGRLNDLMSVFSSNNPLDWLTNMKKLNSEGLSIGGGGDLLGEIAGALIGGMMSLSMLEKTVKEQEKNRIDATLDEKAMALAEKEGIDPSRAKQLVHANAEAGLTANDQQQSQQQQITMRG